MKGAWDRTAIGRKAICLERAAVVLLSLFALRLRAATVDQRSPADYFFSRPNLQSNIVGEIMGSPPSYHVMRSEDVAWLYEAARERAALKLGGWYGLASNATLRAEFGRWSLSDSNRFERWTSALVVSNGIPTTNIVVGYVAVTNLGSGIDTAEIRDFQFPDLELSNPSGDPGGYLAADDSLLISSPTVGDLNGSVTSVWTTTAAATNTYWTNAISVIEMPMTNGSVSVYTNTYNAMVSGVAQVTNVSVRYRNNIDLLFAGGVAAGYTNRIPDSGWWRGTYRAGAVTNYYTWLSGMTRLAGYASYTNILRRDKYVFMADDSPYVVTNGGDRLSEFYYTSQTEVTKDIYQTHTFEYGYEMYPEPGSVILSFYSRWTTNCIFAGGHNRFLAAKLFASVGISRFDDAYSLAGDGETAQSYTFSTNCTVVVPVGTLSLNETGAYHRDALFERNVNLRSVYESALAAAGLSVPVRGQYPNLRFPVPDPGRYGSSSSASTETECFMNFYIVVDFEPWTKMPGNN